ncbi:MAG: DUF1223 domain-containing protein [Alphaproteobacteria bacterium]|nr:DUF1223 domain-containing protein [Alphaproteobacteria bacterium]
MKRLIAMLVIVMASHEVLATDRPAVVELFTSQGCSSCPPADAFLGELAQRKDVVALAYHVSYWDYIGWKDRYSMPEAVERQKTYKTRLSLRSVYTPQMVIDGVNDLVGSDRRRAQALLSTKREGVAVRLAIVGSELNIEIDQASAAIPADILLVAYLPKAETPVGRGENSGRRLQEYNIVRGLEHLGAWKGQAARLTYPLASLPADAKAVALLLQEKNQGAILGAAQLDFTK